MNKPYWFKAKRYGWGWTPSSWQGWLVTLGFLVLELWNFRRIDSISHSDSDLFRPFIIQTFGLIIILISICYLKGEKPKWRWGK